MSKLVPIQYKIIDVLCELIREQLDLSENQVWIQNQKRMISESPGLFVEVAMISSRPFGSSYHCDDDEAGVFTEYQSINMMETYAIILYSRDESAMSRAWEVVAALGGVMAQQLQETYGFRIGELPSSFLDTSALEASARLFRQDLQFNCQRAYYKEKSVNYYNQFSIPPEIHVNQ
jgi:hypothetical protein